MWPDEVVTCSVSHDCSKVALGVLDASCCVPGRDQSLHESLQQPMHRHCQDVWKETLPTSEGS